MQSANKSYISEDLCIAPEYHLAKNTNKELPNIDPDTTKSEYLNSLAVISAFQIFEDIPGIKKNRITIDSSNLVEIWEPIPNRILLTEDLDFLKKDSQRIKLVIEKLIWLGYSWLNLEIFEQRVKIETWQDALNVIQQYNYIFDFITIAFHSSKIGLETHSNKSGESTEYWGVYPNSWQICLIKTRTFNGGYIIDDYNTPYKFNIQVWAGIPFFRNIKTGEQITIESLG